MKLNKSNIEALKSTEKDKFYWDDELKGFGLRVSPKGKKSFLVQYRQDGRSQRVRIGQFGKITAFNARRDARILLGKIAQGKSPADKARIKRNSPTFDEVAQRFIKDHIELRLKPNTQLDYKQILRRYLVPALGPRRVSDIAYNDIYELHLKLKDKPTQANRCVSVLSKMLNMCSRWGYRSGIENPCMQIERYKEKKHNRFLDQEELTRLWAVLDDYEKSGDISLYSVFAFRLLILTGCRLGEIRTLKWDYIKGKHIEFPDSKTGYKRLPLNNEVLAILDTIPKLENNAYVICGSVDGQPVINLQKSWRHIRAKAELDDVRIHDLRHTFASHAVMSGTSLAIVSKLLGHSQISTTMRYAHLADKELLEATNNVGSVISRRSKIENHARSNNLRVVK